MEDRLSIMSNGDYVHLILGNKVELSFMDNNSVLLK